MSLSCRAVFSSWLVEEQRTQAIADHQLVVSIASARVTSSDLHRYLRTWTLPKTTQWCEDTASLTRLLREAKVLWLVDAWDEATREARGLLYEILHSKTESHTVLVTCRPELNASLTDLFSGKVLNVSLVGFDDVERTKLITGMNLDSVSHESLADFLLWLRTITTKEKEFTNPLKLRLLAELWRGGQCSIKETCLPSVLQMYLYRTQWQRNDLVARCQAYVVPGLDVKKKIDAWLGRLYEVSFHSAKRSPSLVLDKDSVCVLLQDCGIRASLCLSSFLEYAPTIGASLCLSQYSFSHDSQRCFFAARYLERCCAGAADEEAKLTEIIEADFKELDHHVDPFLGVFDLVVHLLLIIRIFLSRITCGWICHEASREDLCEVVSRLARKFTYLAKDIHLPQERWVMASQVKCRLTPIVVSVMEMWTSGLIELKISARFLVHLVARLLEGEEDPARWLEVVRRSDYRDDVVKEVSQKVSSSRWVIEDGDVGAAMVLLRHVTPAVVAVVVSGDPGGLPQLRDLLYMLAGQTVTLELHLLMHFYRLSPKDLSDPYLGLVCRDGSRCRLSSFTGYLSKRGVSTLAAAPCLSSLSLRIKQRCAVQELVAVAPQLSRLKSLNLIYDNERFPVPYSSLDGSIGVVVMNGIRSILTLNGIRNLHINLLLPHLRDSSVNAAVHFISGLSKRYETLTVRKLEPRGGRALLAGLDSNAVAVSSLRYMFVSRSVAVPYPARDQ